MVSEDTDQTGLGIQSFCWFCHGASHLAREEKRNTRPENGKQRDNKAVEKELKRHTREQLNNSGDYL